MSFRERENQQVLVPKEENDQVARHLVILINTYQDLPVATVRYESIEPKAPSMTISLVQGTYKTQEYITGSYEAALPFKILYRVAPGASIDKRLQADELLNNIGDWLSRQSIAFGDGKKFIGISRDTQSALADQYESGEEDHQIFLTLRYKVSR